MRFSLRMTLAEIGTEDAAIGMNFVNDDIFQVFKELDPFGMMRQYAGVQHIGIGDDDVPGKAHSVAGIDRCIAVIGKAP